MRTVGGFATYIIISPSTQKCLSSKVKDLLLVTFPDVVDGV